MGPLHAQGCLFCRADVGGFSSREHIFSEAWGNVDEHVLPPGVVRDRCNNGVLSHADEALVNFEPIMLPRAERGLGTKVGKPVIAKFGDTKIAWTAPGTMEVAAEQRRRACHASAQSRAREPADPHRACLPQEAHPSRPDRAAV